MESSNGKKEEPTDVAVDCMAEGNGKRNSDAFLVAPC